jgi:hypothetical protein
MKHISVKSSPSGLRVVKSSPSALPKMTTCKLIEGKFQLLHFRKLSYRKYTKQFIRYTLVEKIRRKAVEKKVKKSPDFEVPFQLLVLQTCQL